MVMKNEAFQNAYQNSDFENIKIEYNVVLPKVIASIMHDNMELFKQRSNNNTFNEWLSEMVFEEIKK